MKAKYPYAFLVFLSLIGSGCMGQKAAQEQSTNTPVPPVTQVSQEQTIYDLGIEKFTVPAHATLDQEVDLVTKIFNYGAKDENTVLHYFVDGVEIQGCRKTISIRKGMSIEDVCKWTPTKTGSHMIKATIDPVTDEILMENNEVPKVISVGPIQPITVSPTTPPTTVPPFGKSVNQ